MYQKMELDVWKGDFGLASFDVKCLQMMAMVKFSGAEVTVNRTNNPFRSPRGYLPVFRHYKQILTSFEDVRLYLNSKNYNPDPGLNEKQLSEIVAYETMMAEKLYPALLFITWMDNKNYIDITRPWYAKALPFPLNYFYPGRYQKQYSEQVISLYPHLELSDIQKEVCKDALICLECISNRLKDLEFFYGDNPSSLDALVYGYLSPLLKIPFPCNPLKNHLIASPNLVKFLVRITQRYFSPEYQEYESHRKKENIRKSSDVSDVAFPHKIRNQIFAGLFATVAMFSYAFWNGIFSISFHTSDSYDDDADVNLAIEEDANQSI